LHLEGHGALFSGIEKLVAGLYMFLLPEAGGELAVLHAQDTGYGLNLGSPPQSILKKEPHALHFYKIGPDF